MRFFFLQFLFCLGVVLFGLVDHAHALTLTPTRQTVVLDPGTSQVVKITLTNDEKETLVAKGDVEGFRVDEKTNRALFGVRQEAQDWIQISPPRVTLAPGESKDISFTIKVPQVVSSTVHYLGLFASVAPEKAQVGIASRVGSLLFLYTSGNLLEQSHIVDFSVGNDWYRKRMANVFVQIQNTGNVHVLPEGRIIFKNWREKEITSLLLNSENRFLFPGLMVTKNYEVPLGLSDIGKVKARLEYVYGLQKHFEVKEITFWYLPVWVVVTAAVSIVVFFYIIISIPLKLSARRK